MKPDFRLMDGSFLSSKFGTDTYNSRIPVVCTIIVMKNNELYTLRAGEFCEFYVFSEFNELMQPKIIGGDKNRTKCTITLL
jgi:hypothetical protein